MYAIMHYINLLHVPKLLPRGVGVRLIPRPSLWEVSGFKTTNISCVKLYCATSFSGRKVLGED